MARTNPQKFLNSLKPHEVSAFVTALMPPGSHLNLVNRRHIFSSSLTLDQLATMRSIRPQDGAFFTKWMECKIQQHHLDQPPKRPIHVTLHLNTKVWPKLIQDKLNNFCISKNINDLKVHSHHIILRSMLGRRHLPLLSTTGKHGSHLCDTQGCLSEEHLCIEEAKVNQSRTKCQGIKLHIFGNTPAEFCIFQAHPCQHGLQHQEANGDFFKYSCRKIQVVFMNVNDIP